MGRAKTVRGGYVLGAGGGGVREHANADDREAGFAGRRQAAIGKSVVQEGSLLGEPQNRDADVVPTRQDGGQPWRLAAHCASIGFVA